VMSWRSGARSSEVNSVADNSKNRERGSQAIHRVLRTLQCWTDDDPTLSLTEIAQCVDLTVPTAHRMIKALQRERFLVQDKVSGKYALGPTIIELARILMQRSDQDELAVIAIPHLERMRARTGETVGLHIPMDDLRLCIAELVSREPMRMATGVGRTFPLRAGASGKVLLAWSPERVNLIVEQLGATKAARKRYMDELEGVRKDGYATSEGETISGASALALPVFGPSGDVRASINVTGPSGRWTKEQMNAHRKALVDEVAHISEQLGHQGPERR